MPLMMQGRPVCHTPSLWSVSLLSGYDVCSKFDSGIEVIPLARVPRHPPRPPAGTAEDLP